jgi:signal transduction histidine kinase/ActR/RegA family two-component response regulator
VLVHAPFKGDSATLERVLGTHYRVQMCAGLLPLAQSVGPDTGLVILTEEALLDDTSALGVALAGQPSWSDIPIILLTSTRKRAGRDNAAVRGRLPLSATNVVMLERPMGSSSLLSTVAAAWRARERQFDMRDRLAELAVERERLRILLENIPVGVCFVDVNGASLISNPLYDRYVPSGVLPSGRAQGHEQWVSVDAQGQSVPPPMFPGARALRGEIVEGVEFCHKRPGAPDFWIRVSAVPLWSARNTIMGAALVIVDINEQKQAEMQLRQFNERLELQVVARTQALATALDQLRAESAERERAQEQLRHSLKMEAVGQLTGGIAHDFNNMLTGVLGALDLISLRLAKGSVSGIDRYIEAAQRSARRAASLTQRLLAFSRRQSLDARAVAVNELIATLLDLLNRSVTEQVQVVLTLSDPTPWALADANQLENALLNLVLNARDAMPEGGAITLSTQTVTIGEQLAELDALSPGEYVRIDVQDTGTGIPPDILPRVIEPFFTTKPQGQGTGLGLSMVYGFARQSHGRLAINSRAGGGTIVSIYLPAAAPKNLPAPAPERQAAPGTGQLILLVEDDDSVRMLNQEVLLELGYEVLIAQDATQALDVLHTLPRLDLLVTDVGLPGLNGRQLAEIVQQQRPGLPVLFLTGYAKGAASRADFLGPNMKLLTKPFELEALAGMVSSMLGSASAGASGVSLGGEA